MTSTAQGAVTGADPATKAGGARCFHCGEPVPAGVALAVEIEGRPRPMCCQGCKAVAEAIVEAGLTDFYRYRQDRPGRPRELVPEALREMELYDRPELQRQFVRAAGEGAVREAALILEGIVCAACVWLTERHVARLPGVLAFQVNYATRRARVRWDASRTRLSEILKAIAAIGYVAHPFDPGRQEAVARRERAAALRRLAVAGLGMAQVMMLAVALYAGEASGMAPHIRALLRWASLLLATPVVLYSGAGFFAAAWRDLRRRRLGMDVPVALAIGAAYLASAWHTVRGAGEVYFDSVTMFVFFLLTGRYLEMAARHRAGRAMDALARLLPATATRLGDDGAEETVAVAELAPGERVRVRPGETVPADGVVLEGESAVNEAVLTGERLPRAVAPGARVIGGSINTDSPLVVRIEHVGEETVLASIQRLLDRAQAEKPRVARLADRAAAWFVGALLAVATGVGLWWWQHEPQRAFEITLAVLVVTCPCALSLATPAAVTAATGALMRLGLVTTRGHALETLARATHLVLDKTGTLTTGRLRVEAVRPVRDGVDADEALALAAALEAGSEHPIAEAVRAAARVRGLAAPAAGGLRSRPGRGVEGEVAGRRLRLGTEGFVGAAGVVAGGADTGARSAQPRGAPQRPQASAPAPGTAAEPPGGAPGPGRAGAATAVVLADEAGPLAVIELGDELRTDAAEAVAALRALGLEVGILSGDRPEAVAEVARRLGIRRAEGGLTPEGKLERIRALQRAGAVVAMVGDGVNDAAVLAAAQVSVAMASGTQLAQASADMVLLSGRLGALAEGVRLARRTLAVVRQNIAWAVGYNLLALPAAAAGWVAPWMAAIGMSASSLVVVLNALRLGRGPGRAAAPATAGRGAADAAGA